jgi:hypothetical protein
VTDERDHRYVVGLTVDQGLRGRRGVYPAMEYVEDRRLLPYDVPADTRTQVRLGWHERGKGGDSYTEFMQRRWDLDTQRLRCADADDLYDLRLHYTLTLPIPKVPPGAPAVSPAPPRLPAALRNEADIGGPTGVFLAHSQTINTLPYALTWQFSAYTGEVFLANGCAFYLVCSTPVRISAIGLLIVQRR